MVVCIRKSIELPLGLEAGELVIWCGVITPLVFTFLR